ncbi:TP53I3 [Bugula neritina]|uniref:TP53I3 n=1 Tax=Bugula neritina TaxID=10212 RepID=A0A7J7JBA4_BUGNE|nr:TP53I3 [Bugula neritina]
MYSTVVYIQVIPIGEGVDLVIDCVGGSYWQQNTDVLKTDGRWVLYGLMGGANVDGALLRKLLSKRISILPSTLKTRNKQYKADLIRSFETNILPAFDSKALKPVIDRSFELEDIGKAHALMESNLNAGKILLKVIPTTKEEL